MIGDDDFKPKLGKIKSLGSKGGAKYVQKILHAISRAGGRVGARRKGFDGSRIGRGAGVGRVLKSRDQFAAHRQRRVIIKARFVRIKAGGKRGGIKGAQLHLSYIQRGGVTREGEPGELYSASVDRTDGKAFLENCRDDRHQFRFIVAAEDADQYQELKPLIRSLMGQMEKDLATKLDWVAVDHFNTGHAHSHIVLRGVDDRGDDLVIAREYLSHGMRERAAEIISLDLGPRTDLEIQYHLRKEVDQERLTGIDRGLLREADGQRIVGPSARPLSPFQQSIRAGRLQKLSQMGLAEETAPGRWRLAEGLETTLREIGERGDIIKTLNRELREKGISAGPQDYAIYSPIDPNTWPIIGRVVSRGLSDEINDRHYLIVEATDGYAHYVDIGRGEDTESLPEGAVISITAKKAEPREVDRTVAEIAAANGGRYSEDIHLRHDRTATAGFAETHVRRLEAMRKLAGIVERQPDGTWLIAPDHIERAKRYELDQAKTAPVQIEKLSSFSVERQIASDGATWLDQELVASSPIPLREAGFGKAAREAQNLRRQWLLEQGLAESTIDNVVVRSDVLARLRRRELARVSDQLEKELGLRYRDPAKDRHVSGTYRKSIDLVSGKYAIIEGRNKEFSLVPWRPVLERNLGREVSGIMRGDQISWTIGRGRSGPER
jgi:type IV secretory pathway VirD2 relaxase